MPMTVIRGSFHVKGASPDGDSIHFVADNEATWGKLQGAPSLAGALHAAQLRLEGIDALETHYTPPYGHAAVHQPKQFAEGARTRLMQALGITNVKWTANGSRVTSADGDGAAGYILARATDKYRRPVAFVYAGAPAEADGTDIMLDVARLKQSVNYTLMAEGVVFPTYYKGLFPDLRHALTQAAQAARTAGEGLWPQDKTNTGVNVPALNAVSEQNISLPKLFRRIAEYLELGGGIDEAGFRAFLQSKQDTDQVLVVSTGHFTHLDNLVTIHGDNVKLDQPPENIVFYE
ncbi:MAG TPA: thermonuclease family protein [Ktedonobacterales bacterium]